MVKVSKGLGPIFEDKYNQNLSKVEKKQMRYVATKNKEAFSWVGDKLWYKVSQKIKAVFGRSDFQAMKQGAKEIILAKKEVLESLTGENIDKKKLKQLVDFEIDLYVQINQFSLDNKGATKEEIEEFAQSIATKHGISEEQIDALRS